MAITERNTVKIELEAEEILALTTVMNVFKDLTTGLELEVPKELKHRMANIVEKIMLELLYDEGLQ